MMLLLLVVVGLALYMLLGEGDSLKKPWVIDIVGGTVLLVAGYNLYLYWLMSRSVGFINGLRSSGACVNGVGWLPVVIILVTVGIVLVLLIRKFTDKPGNSKNSSINA